MSPPHAPVPRHVLARRLQALNQKIHRSLPWGCRVAGLLIHLAADSLDAFGRTAYALMVEAVVRGMPDSPSGRPATDYVQEVHLRGPDALPSGYGKPFASRVYKILLVKFGDPQVTEEAMSRVMLQAARGKLHIANGSGLHEAEAYLITSAMNAARDVLRSQGRRREESLTRKRDVGDATIDIEDPNAFAEVERALSPADMQRVLRGLERVHPRARAFAEAVLNGESQTEIAKAWNVSPSYVSKWLREHREDIGDVLRHRLREARVSYSYDCRV
jgi:DNA-directed RNA polymerase specialized sigma24 family protein